MTTPTPGWDGPPLTLEAQSIILVKYFMPALEALLREMALIHRDLKVKMSGEDVAGMIQALNDHPFFMGTLHRYTQGFGEFGDDMMRWTDAKCFEEATPELADAIIYTAIGMWIQQGCTMPDGYFDEDDVAEEE